MIDLRVLLIACVACGGPSQQQAPGEASQAPAARTQVGSLSVAVPDSWTATKPTSSMRVAQWTLSGAGAEAELIVYHFGPGAGGGVADNLRRWYRQFEQPDGSKTADKAVVSKRPIDGVPVTTVDLSGTYVAETRPGSGRRLNQPAWRMLAAVVEVAHGSYYIKLVGPSALVAAHADRWKSFIDSIRAAAPTAPHGAR